MSGKRERKEHTHEGILEAAARLVRERGIAGTRIADVMEAAGLTVGGFYAHFSSKEALIDETLRRTGRRMRARLLANLEPSGDVALRLLERYVSFAHREQQLDAPNCPLPAVVGEVATTAAAHRPVLAEELELLLRELEPRMPATGPLPPRPAALALMVLMYGGLSLSRALRGSRLSDDLLIACRALGRLLIDRAQAANANEELPS